MAKIDPDFHDNDWLADDGSQNEPSPEKVRARLFEYVLSKAAGHLVHCYWGSFGPSDNPVITIPGPRFEVLYQIRPAGNHTVLEEFYVWYCKYFDIWYASREESAAAYLEAWDRWKAGDRRVRDGGVLRYDREEEERNSELEPKES